MSEDKTLVEWLDDMTGRWCRYYEAKLYESDVYKARQAKAFIEAQAAEITRLRESIAIAAVWTAVPGTTIAEIRAALGGNDDR